MSASNRFVRVFEVMTSEVRTASPGDGLREVWGMLLDERCHHLPVADGKRPVGMISTRDLLRISGKNGGEKLSSGDYGDRTANEIMSRDLETIHVDESVEAAIDRIGRGDIHALVVVNDADELAGIVTNHDLLHYLIS